MGRIIIGCKNDYILNRIKKVVGNNYQIYTIEDNVVSFRRSLTQHKPDFLIIDSSYQIPNISILLENVTFNDTPIIYISSSYDIKHIYNLSNYDHFHLVNTNNIERDLLTLLNTVDKYMSYIKKMKYDLSSIKEELEEEKAVNKAKILLMEQKHLSEKEAYIFIRRTAMDKRCSKKDVAELIIKKYNN